jgi:hypothetical protein
MLRIGEILAEEAADLLALHRPAEVVALADVAAHPAQGRELGRVLHPSATVTSCRLWPRRTIVRASSALSLAWLSRSTNERSILSMSTGKRYR